MTLIEPSAVIPRAVPLRRGLPFLGEVLTVWRDPLALMLKGMRQGDPVVGFRFGPYRYFLVNDPAGAEHVLLRNVQAYRKAPTYHALRLILGEGLVTSEGDLWKRQRRLVQPAFHHRALVSFADTIVEVTDDTLDRWTARGSGGSLDIHREMNALTFRIVGRTLFSTDLAADAPRVGEALEFLLAYGTRRAENMVAPPVWLPTPANLRYRRMLRVIDDLVQRLVADRRAQRQPQRDLLHLLLTATDEEGAMSPEQLRDELVTLALAGHETTGNALAFTWYLLSKHPDVRRRIRREVRDALGDRRPGFADLDRLPVVGCVVKESLRLFPPAWIMERQAIEEDVVAGCRIPSGSLVGIAPYTLHRDPRLWPDPESFEPDRFEPGADAQRPRFAYLPFGGGPRVCLGNAFAMMELRLAVARMLQRVSLDLRPGFRLELNAGITLRPKRGVPMQVTQTELPDAIGGAT